jgi:hypothetical protein
MWSAYRRRLHSVIRCVDFTYRPITVVDLGEFLEFFQVMILLGHDQGSRFRPRAGWLGLERRLVISHKLAGGMGDLPRDKPLIGSIGDVRYTCDESYDGEKGTLVFLDMML